MEILLYGGASLATTLAMIVAILQIQKIRGKTKTIGKAEISKEFHMPKIRPLQQRDREFFTDLLKKIMEYTEDDSLSKMISSKRAEAKATSESDEEEMGKFIASLVTGAITSGLGKFDDLIVPWIQDLLEVTPEEYSKLPMNIEIQVLTHMINDPSAGGFFMHLLRGARAKRLFGILSTKANETFGPIFGSAMERIRDSITEK